ncbi:MAG TPA: hypothetical protein VMU11_02635, partial [Verrucomicrobiae bacterium]|nr:hypothetical protein [Verrucomicrobiae bacterium]
LHRRFIYEKDKTWRVKYSGTYQGKSAVLLVDGMMHEEDEETIRIAFREQATGSRVRPPMTYVHQAFDEAKGYGFTLEERVDGAMLYRPDEDPEIASAKFAEFYRELNKALTKPFWPNEHGPSALDFSAKQLDKWMKLAEEKEPGSSQRYKDVLVKIRASVLAGMEGKELCFMHPHLCGPDIRLGENGEYIVFGNHFWSWRQPGYDIAFPVWHQWMHLPEGKRTAADVQHITDVWMKQNLTDEKDLRAMLLNRVFGSLILDLPAKAKLAPESEASVAPLFGAFVAEGERLLG